MTLIVEKSDIISIVEGVRAFSFCQQTAVIHGTSAPLDKVQANMDDGFLFGDYMETKTCKFCGETKPITEFHPNGSSRPGYRTRCKKCYGDTYGTWYDSHKKEKHDAYKKWADSHPGARREKRLSRLYGIDLKKYQSMYDAQNGNCAICGKHEDKLHVDHSHKNGEVRGLLCGNCNRAIGIMQDDVSVLGNAIKYLKGFIK